MAKSLISILFLFPVLSWAVTPLLPNNYLSVPILRQATHYSCGASALQAVLQYWKVFEGGESELYKVVGTTEKDGSSPWGLSNAAKTFGLKAEYKENLGLPDLQTYLAQGITVILDLQAWRDDAEANIPWRDSWENGHYVVLIGMGENKIFVMDPSTASGYAYVPIDEFLERWHDYETMIDGSIWRNQHLGIIIQGQDFLSSYPAAVEKMN